MRPPRYVDRRAAGALLAVVIAAGLAACGESASPPSAPASSSSPIDPVSEPTPGTASPSGSESASGPTTAPPVPPSPPSEYEERVRVDGRVVDVESGCVALVTSNDVRWQLVGPTVAELARGDDVVVRGAPRPGAQGCPDGPVLAVERVSAPG